MSDSRFFGDISIRGVEHDAGDCVDGQQHQWNGPRSSAADGTTIAAGIKCSNPECCAIWIDIISLEHE